ncbi:hypothetical protein [Micromonospora zamorensis]|uniref:hypothetical protein n=1 Tax=Micromonospora zamorensis TaxID=709883 RepID=UPI003CE80595
MPAGQEPPTLLQHLSEVTLVAADGSFGVYVQVKQTDGVDRTDEVLGTLRVDTSVVAQR